MNGSNINNSLKPGMSFPAKPKSLTPSVLGMSNSHGVKLSVNMTSEDKKELMSKLEEWRKARKDKLAARILTKNHFEKPKATMAVPAPKSRPSGIQRDGATKFQDRQSVFERLYNNSNNGKIKKPDVNSGLNRPTLIPKPGFKKPSLTPLEKQNKPSQVSNAGADGTNLSHASDQSAIPVVPGKCQASASDEPLAENSKEDRDGVLSGGSAAVEVLADVPESTTTTTTPSETDSLQTEKELTADSVKVIPPADIKEADCHKSGQVCGSFGAKAAVLSVEPEKQKNPLRRSISMMFRQNCRNEYAIRRSVSAKNLKEFNLSQQNLNRKSVRIVPKLSSGTLKEKSEISSKSVSFVTPKPNKSLGSSNLRSKLEDWLKKNGHPLESYRHLRCFGIPSSEKSLPSAAPLSLEHSFENSDYATAPNTPLNDSDKENLPPPALTHQVDVSVVENWLKDLYRLTVQLKYPPERCEEWLTAIRKKCNACTQLPIYWECLAALHESKGDLKSAIEDYERAIIKGGEVDAVGESLAQLFEKMLIEQKHRSKPKLEKGLDPKNIFKSTIIKFALQQKAIKNLSAEIDPGVRQQLYVATPVRRSTRIQTPYKSTAEVASLQALTPDLRKNLIFKPNESLLRGD